MKKRTLCAVFALLLAFGFLAGCNSGGSNETTAAPTTAAPTTAAPADPVIRCSTTTSVNDSGLMGYLEPLFEAETGYDLQITSNGSGAAIALGRSGDADVLLVHSKDDEEKFVSEGYGVERIPFMFNFFVIAGPADDPAAAAGSANAAEAFKKIADGKNTFVSRGDDSGTHKKELKIWKAAALTPDAAKDTWYLSAGKGMGDCLTMANEQSAYILTDKGTFLSMKDKLDIKILLAESDDMKNTYSLIACSTAKNPDVNAEGAQAFIDWMTKQETLDKIAEYGKTQYGEALFSVMK